jgi:hypothetical protein
MPQVHPQDLAAPSTNFPGREASELSILPRTREIDSLVRSVMATWNGPGALLQKRRWHRILFRKPIVLTPLDEHSGESDGEPMVAHGHDISLGGISFTHASPLPFRLMAVTLVRADGQPESVVTRLTWCRFTRDGFYRSGGQFLRKIEIRFEQGAEWDALPPA